jgi:hypothetical protein
MSKELNELQDHVWRRLGVRRLVAGRKRSNDLVEATVANWDSQAIANAKDPEQLDVVIKGISAGVKRTHQMLGDCELEEYGFIWAILLQALVGAIVQIIIKWWMESSENKLKMWALKKELCG